MPDVPPLVNLTRAQLRMKLALRPSRWTPRPLRPCMLLSLGATLTALVVFALVDAGCVTTRHGMSGAPNRLYPPEPQPPRVVALGNLRGGPPPSNAEIRLAEFLFGAPPPPPLTIANPVGLASGPASVLVCDPSVSAIFRWDPVTGRVDEEPFTPPVETPYAADVAPDGTRYICDRLGVRRSDSAGRTLATYVLPAGESYRPGGVLAVDDEVWVTNVALHRIEIFNANSAAHLRSIGALGVEPGHFILPRSLARAPDGNICVVDVLNARVQVFAPAGEWIRQIGGLGDVVGRFGRPKDVAVGPDGTIFVTDAFSQRVHAFSSDGAPLLAFGEPDSGVGALRMPSGIAISTSAPGTGFDLPPDVTPLYYIWVGEQVEHPGVRLYAWVQPHAGAEQGPAAMPALARAPPQQWPAVNPHYDAERCGECHKLADGAVLPIPLDQTDALCLACHDGVKASAEPHPIGRPGKTELVVTPEDWPQPNSRIGCVTCHGFADTVHCSRTPRRPAVNANLLRGFNPREPLGYCGNCHRSDVGGRFSPHRQRDASGRIREDACFFCHTVRPSVPEDGKRRFEPHLRVETSDLCLNCHTRHWDLSPKGHVDRPVTPKIREWMIMRELALQNPQATDAELARLAADPRRHPAVLPLGRNAAGQSIVTCYSCHNPHYAGLFPPGSELGALAPNTEDRRGALRTNWIDLCSDCHQR